MTYYQEERIKFTINEVGRETRNDFLLEEILYDVVFDSFTETFEEAEVLVSNMKNLFSGPWGSILKRIQRRLLDYRY